MKLSVLSSAAAAALFVLSACGGDAASEKSTTTAPDKPGEAAHHESGDPPAAPPPGANATQAPAAGEPAAASGPPADPPVAFLQCRSCHAVEPGKNGVGPTLAGVVGKPAASVAGFRYSDALRKAGITWNREKLDEWLAGPMRMVPGSRMVQSVRDAAQRKAIIDYLETLK